MLNVTRLVYGRVSFLSAPRPGRKTVYTVCSFPRHLFEPMSFTSVFMSGGGGKAEARQPWELECLVPHPHLLQTSSCRFT